MESKGIEADLPQTNLEAVIPEEQRVLLEVNSDRYGIHQQMEKLLISTFGSRECHERKGKRSMSFIGSAMGSPPKPGCEPLRCKKNRQ